MEGFFQNKKVFILGLDPAEDDRLKNVAIRSYEEAANIVRFLGGEPTTSLSYFLQENDVQNIVNDIASKKFDCAVMVALSRNEIYENMSHKIKALYNLLQFYFGTNYSMSYLEDMCIKNIKKGDKDENPKEPIDPPVDDNDHNGGIDQERSTLGEKILQQNPLLQPRTTFESRDPISGI